MANANLSNDALIHRLETLCRHERKGEVKMMMLLLEVEERRLHLDLACSSLFDFCMRKLGMSEGNASRRIRVARLAQRFPQVLAHLESGRIHVTNLSMVAALIEATNVDDWVDAIAGKSKRQVEELVAKAKPRPDVPSSLRKLPTPTPSAPPPVAVEASRPSDTPTDPSYGSPCSAPPPTFPTRAFQAPIKSPPSRTEPLSEKRFLLKVTVTRETREKLERLQDLMSHRNPSRDLAVLVETAIEALLAKVEQERLGKTDRPHRSKAMSDEGAIAQSVRREVFERDGAQCTFISKSGQRCPCRSFLELDHIIPRAMGGKGDATNIRVRCAAHNRAHAEAQFGREHVALRIREARAMHQKDSSLPLHATWLQNEERPDASNSGG